MVLTKNFIGIDGGQPAFVADFFESTGIEKTGYALKKWLDEYEYGYNGQMKDNEYAGLGNHLDFGARGYDPRTGRWPTPDQLKAMYPGVSPYAFALNTPIQAKDPDGRIVIFVNGQHRGNDVGWRYWLPVANSIMDAIGDHNYMFYDGALGGWNNTLKYTNEFLAFLDPYWNLSAEDRYRAGYAQGKTDAEFIVKHLQRNKDGEIVESIKLIAHSMGGVYAKGLGNAVLDYANANHINGVKIDFEVDFASFQPGSKYNTAIPGVRTIQVSHQHDGVVNSKLSLGSSYETKEKGVSLSDYHLNADNNKGHSLQDFKDEINYVPPSSSNGGGGNAPAPAPTAPKESDFIPH